MHIPPAIVVPFALGQTNYLVLLVLARICTESATFGAKDQAETL